MAKDLTADDERSNRATLAESSGKKATTSPLIGIFHSTTTSLFLHDSSM
ncbi:hypothetical protein ACFLS0_04395 [Candidatus Bipolaricaulota bacterium]